MERRWEEKGRTCLSRNLGGLAYVGWDQKTVKSTNCTIRFIIFQRPARITTCVNAIQHDFENWTYASIPNGPACVLQYSTACQ